jgi:hypothetical protein
MTSSNGLVQIHHRIKLGSRGLSCNHYVEASVAASFPSEFMHNFLQESMSQEDFSIWHDLALEKAVEHSIGFSMDDETVHLTHVELKIEDIHVNDGNPYRGDMGYVTKRIWIIDAESLPKFLVKIKADSLKELATRLESEELEELTRLAKLMSQDLGTYTNNHISN